MTSSKLLNNVTGYFRRLLEKKSHTLSWFLTLEITRLSRALFPEWRAGVMRSVLLECPFTTAGAG
jgi:hypothetical protein